MLISHDVNYQNIEHLEQTAEDKTLPTSKLYPIVGQFPVFLLNFNCSKQRRTNM